jgi:hypothetical protein
MGDAKDRAEPREMAEGMIGGILGDDDGKPEVTAHLLSR